MDFSINFNEDVKEFEFKEDDYVLKIDSIQSVMSNTHRLMFQASFLIKGTDMKINYVNFIYTDTDQNFDLADKGVNFGMKQLKCLIKAAGIDTSTSLNISIIPKLLLNKEVMAHVQKDDKDHLVIKPMSYKPTEKEAEGVAPSDTSAPSEDLNIADPEVAFKDELDY